MSKKVRDFLPAAAASPDKDPPIPRAAIPVMQFERPWDRRMLAEFLRLSVSGLDKLVAAGRGPPGVRAGRLLRWRPDVVRRWVEWQESAKQ
jgi:hypothetical protein